VAKAHVDKEGHCPYNRRYTSDAFKVGAIGEEDVGRSCRRVLVVDDDPDTCTLFADILTQDGCTVRSCLTAEEALDVLEQQEFDLVLADIKMPRMTGIDLLRCIRETNRDTKVIIMTAYASLDSAIEAFRSDAWDYLVKPFSLPDLRQRVREALSYEADAGQLLCYLDLCLDLRARRVWVGGREEELTRQEFDLLAYLFGHKGCTVTWQELLEQVWGYEAPPKERMSIVRSCIHRLREKIEDDPRHPRYIMNRWGEGYRLGE